MMHTLLAFAATLVLITLLGVRYRILPFILLIGGAVFFGITAGIPPDQIFPAIASGTGKVFSNLGIIIFSGALIAEVMRESRFLERILSDVRGLVREPAFASGVSGYLLSIPLMCCITGFMVLSPLVARLDEEFQGEKRLLYLAAVGSVLSYGLVYPSPVIYSVAATPLFGGSSPWGVDLLTIPLSLALLGLVCAAWRPWKATEGGGALRTGGTGAGAEPAVPSRIAWIPLAIPVLLVLAGLALPPLRFFADPSPALLAGVAVAFAAAPADARGPAAARGARHAGIIIFDLCGAGALAGIITRSDFSVQAFQALGAGVPAAIIPFALAAILMAALGSRVAVAVVVGALIGQSPLAGQVHPLVMILLIGAGILSFSYVTDPYFWLVKRVTGDDTATVVRNYTLPLAICGILTLALALFLGGYALRPG